MTTTERAVAADGADSAGRDGHIAQRVAQELQHEVVSGGWQIGHLLGSEADLAERFGVSRPTIREAARILEHRSVARMRRGPGGGLVITAPDPELTAEEAALYLHYKRVRGSQLLEVRNGLELNAVQLAAERVDTTGIERLRACVEHEETLDAGPGEDAADHARLHFIIAELTGNPAMELFIRMILKVITDRYEAGFHRIDGAHLACVVDDHRVITEAVCAGDAALAHFHMKHHLERALG